MRRCPSLMPEIHGSWKALFICPNEKIIRDLAPLLRTHLPTFSGHDLKLTPRATSWPRS